MPRHDPARSTGQPAEEPTVRTRKRTRAERSADGDELESWLHDLVDGEATARRYRQRLRAERTSTEDTCTVCRDAETGTDHFGLDGHVHGRFSA
jgi:hypothetical protein